MVTDGQGNGLALKRQFLEHAKALSPLDEVFRCRQVPQLLCDMLAFGIRAEAEVFENAYGDPQGREYWGTLLSEPVRVYSFAHVLAVHVAENAEQLDMARIAIIRAFRDAAEAGEQWFVGETGPILAMKDGQTDFANLIKLKVFPRPALEWLMSKPRRRHLVPDSLRAFLEFASAVAVRPIIEMNAEHFVTRYINDETAAGRHPTQTGLEDAAKKAGIRGGREDRRAAFHRLIDVRRGRPRLT
jgi:hypothetical protein